VEFVKFLLLELVLLVCASLVICNGVVGMVASGIVLSGINFWFNDPSQVLKWELILMLGIAVGLGGQYFASHKARNAQFSVGLMGGIVGFIVFGAFVTPVLAIVLWLITIGFRMFAGLKKGDMIWGAAPALWRSVLALGIVLYGNTVC